MVMRWKLVIAILVLSFFSGIIWADEEALRKAIQPHFAGHNIESLKKTPYFGLY